MAVLSTPTERGEERRRRFERALGGAPCLVFYGSIVGPSDVHSTAARIFAAHYNATLALVNDPPARSHVLLCEDDCEFADGVFPVERLNEAVRTMRANGYVVCGVGVMGLSALIPARGGLFHSPANTLAHCQLLDIAGIRPFVTATPRDQWRANRFVESWNAVPLHSRVIMWPTLAFQNVVPKDLAVVVGNLVDPERLALLTDLVTAAASALVPSFLVACLAYALVAVKKESLRLGGLG